jgi:hypothetical protein
MSTNRLMEKMSRVKMDKVTRDWTKPHNNELHIWYRSLNIFHVINSCSMKPVAHVAHMGESGKDTVMVE